MRNYLTILALFLVTITQAQIMLPAYQAIQYRRNTLPTIITTSATSLTSNSAVSGGTITNDGGTPITLRGVCWSTTPLPTTALATKTTDGTGIGNYTSTMIGLTIGTTYYIRAYATNNVGTYSRTNDDTRYRKLPKGTLTTFDMMDDTIKENLLKKGWTKEKFDSISQEERDQAIKCIAF